MAALLVIISKCSCFFVLCKGIFRSRFKWGHTRHLVWTLQLTGTTVSRNLVNFYGRNKTPETTTRGLNASCVENTRSFLLFLQKASVFGSILKFNTQSACPSRSGICKTLRISGGEVKCCDLKKKKINTLPLYFFLQLSK